MDDEQRQRLNQLRDKNKKRLYRERAFKRILEVCDDAALSWRFGSDVEWEQVQRASIPPSRVQTRAHRDDEIVEVIEYLMHRFSQLQLSQVWLDCPVILHDAGPLLCERSRIAPEIGRLYANCGQDILLISPDFLSGYELYWTEVLHSGALVKDGCHEEIAWGMMQTLIS